MKFKEGYKVRSMAGENVVIMQGTAGCDMTRIISLNDSSLLLWNELQGKEFEVADVAAVLVENYGIDTEVAEHDAKLGETVTVKTATGRVVEGKLVAVNPTYIHTYGEFQPELLKIEQQLKEIMYGGEN
jgi:hypothetical protein